jgi:hypothetical protein
MQHPQPSSTPDQDPLEELLDAVAIARLLACDIDDQEQLTPDGRLSLIGLFAHLTRAVDLARLARCAP